MLSVIVLPASVCTPSSGWVTNASVAAVDPVRSQFMNPVTPKAAVFFAYGHFYQMPELGQMFDHADYSILTPSSPLLTDLVIGESPPWHENRLWFAHWGTEEIVAVDLEGANPGM